MHEYSLVEALVRRVETEAARRGALHVHSLTVSVGELAGVEPELFRTAYETFRAGTLCERAELRLVQHPAAWTCPTCKTPIEKGAVLRCPQCGGAAKLDERSDALLLESIDMEVP